jgi:hypothetical protein
MGLKSNQDHAQNALPARFWIVSSISARVNGFEITLSTAVLSLEKTVSFPAPVMMTTRVQGELFFNAESQSDSIHPGHFIIRQDNVEFIHKENTQSAFAAVG